MLTIVLLSPVSPSPLAEELGNAGLNVFEALSTSEVLCERNRIDAVVIASGCTTRRLSEIKQKKITLEIAEATGAAEIVFELDNLFGKHASVH